VRVLSSNLNRENSKLSTSSAWVVLFELRVGATAADYIRYAANNADVVFGGYTYLKSNLKVDSVRATSKGELPSLNVSVENVSLGLNSSLESYDGFVDYDVAVYRVNSAYLAEDYTALTTVYSIMAVEEDEEWITFTLGGVNPLRKRYPSRRFLPQHCNWAEFFKGVECKYTGAEEICDGSYKRCKDLGNTLNFGGYPGLSAKGYRVV